MFEEKKMNLFPKSLMGTTMQEGSTRERRGHIESYNIYTKSKVYVNLKNNI